MIKFSNQKEIDDYINNLANYKPTYKKSYSIWCARPTEGTQIYNKLEQFSTYASQIYPFILSGTRGEMWAVSLEYLSKNYTFEDGAEITAQSLKKLETNNIIDWFKITTKPNSIQKWACFMPIENVFQLSTNLGLIWCNKPNLEVEHHKGDFIVCNDKDGKPDSTDHWVVNGAVFVDTYDGTNFEEYLGVNKNQHIAPKPTMVIK